MERPDRRSQRRASAVLFAVTLLSAAGAALAVDRKTLETDVPPEMKDGRVFVPLRAAGTALGGKVDWDASTQTVNIKRGTHTVVLTVGQTSAKVDGQDRTLDSPPYLKDGRVLVPLRFAGEALQV